MLDYKAKIACTVLRGSPVLIYPPSPEEIRAARGTRTQVQAGRLVHAEERKWQRWEAGDSKMPLAAWELLLLKTGRMHLTLD